MKSEIQFFAIEVIINAIIQRTILNATEYPNFGKRLFANIPVFKTRIRYEIRNPASTVSDFSIGLTIPVLVPNVSHPLIALSQSERIP